MPQVDFEALVQGSALPDGKVVCESTLPDHAPDAPPKEGVGVGVGVDVDVDVRLDPDLPAESFRVPIGDELEWVDRNAAAFYDRDDSTKGTTNPKSHNSNPNPNPVSSTNSQRFSGSLKPKAPIIGLPNKVRVHHAGLSARKTGRFSGPLIIPKKRGGAGQGKRGSAVPEVEPGSPKVSCFGKVLSERERDRCRQAIRELTGDRSRSAAKERRGGRGGFWGGLLRRFACCNGTRTVNFAEEETDSYRTSTATAEKKGRSSFDAARAGEEPEPAPAPGLGGMRKLSSGRRAASWGEVEIEVDAGGRSGPLTGIRGRREMGELNGLDCARDLEKVGPSSV